MCLCVPGVAHLGCCRIRPGVIEIRFSVVIWLLNPGSAAPIPGLLGFEQELSKGVAAPEAASFQFEVQPLARSFPGCSSPVQGVTPNPLQIPGFAATKVGYDTASASSVFKYQTSGSIGKEPPLLAF